MTAKEVYNKKVNELEKYPYTEFHLKKPYAIEAMKEYARIKTDEMKMRHLEILNHCPIGEEISSIEKSEFNNFD